MTYEEILSDANNLYKAYKASVKGSKWKETTQKFMMNFLRYIFSIQEEILDRTLQNGPTEEFTLSERGRIIQNGEISYDGVENMFRGWMGSFYKLLSKQQRRNLIGLYEDLFDKTVTVVNKKLVIFDRSSQNILQEV